MKRRGSIRLVETANPVMGVVYTVWDRSLGIWRGTDKIEAEQQFDRAQSQLRIAREA